MRTCPFLLAFVLSVAGCHSTAATNGPTTDSNSTNKPSIVAFEVLDSREGSRVDLSFEGDTMYVRTISPGGIGHTRLELTSGAWPKKVVVSLRYAPDRPFRSLESCDAHLEVSRTRSNEEREGLQVRPRTIEETLGLEIGPIPPTGHRVLCIDWIDAFRR